MSAAWMVEGKIGGAELGQAILMLIASADSAIGESTLVNPVSRLWSGSTKGSLGTAHIVDDEMEVERKMRG